MEFKPETNYGTNLPSIGQSFAQRTGEGQQVAAPWLTVVIPSYCGEKWVRKALESVVSEAARGVEVVLVDGSPNSSTREIACSFADRLRLRVFARDDLKSWQAKTNFGVQVAESPHICWLGVDDIWLPGRATAVQKWILNCPTAPLHLAPSAFIDKQGRKLGVWRARLPADTALSAELVTERLLVQNFIAAPAPVFRKDAWIACGGLDETLWYTADWDVWLKLAQQASVLYHDSVTTGFRVHGASLTVTGSRDAAAFEQQMRIVLERHACKLGDGAEDLLRVARASIAVNAALAAAAVGNRSALLPALYQVLSLGPAGTGRYFLESRILERVLARVQAKLRGAY